ncbi:DNA polymerase III subunit gamma/tau [Legionella sp. km772]|uniref:DNA polymerase III subunit gamma/tau n=1 Tax=Legionella sp. km772 TaxID=2498111 RepID=UPI000F8F7B57|nr:DNA polymerase III subunit gamma/tau [Legionella sp. km772]RUR06017.1 DNA polymerase III subunit gamma/tau [Legionella sp. km772]
MTYLALARKWRPRIFSQLIGQEHVSKPLINALNQQRLHHAYLFTGTRGVGKTSVARILAKALNCDQGITAQPCLSCDACQAIEQGRFIDLIEIDGASKTRVEDTRDVLDNVQYAPTNGRFKIYLIDEVHMLSQHSFNALLKTLEEPPLHVKFILATTDPQKLPVTVLSRCLQFNLRHIAAELIQTHLQFILNEEQFGFEDEALAILAHAAQGSMRDALSLLDQAITGCDTRLLTQEVKRILGYTQQDYALQLLQALAQQNAAQLLLLSQQIVTEGGHFHYVLDNILDYLHQICIYQNVGEANPLLKARPELIQLAAQFSAEDVQLFYHIAIKGREEISLAPTLMIGFNMTLLRMLTFRPAAKASTPTLAYSYQPAVPSDGGAIDTVRAHEVAAPTIAPIIESTSEAVYPTENLTPEASFAAEVALPTIAVDAPLPQIELCSSNWPTIVSQLKLTGLALNALDNAEFLNKEDKIISLRVARGHQSLFSPTAITKIESALSEYFNSSLKIKLHAEEQIVASPAQHKEKLIHAKQQKASLALDNDVVFQQLQKEFSAELVKNSIVALKDDL